MAMKTLLQDSFANKVQGTITESNLNTLTFTKIESGAAMFDKVAWVINRIEWTIVGELSTQLNTTGDSFDFGITNNNALTTVIPSLTACLNWNRVQRQDVGTAASGFENIFPIVNDYTNMPGGGILVPPVPLYFFQKGTGAAAASTIYVNLYYQIMQLKPDEYWQLVESLRAITV